MKHVKLFEDFLNEAKILTRDEMMATMRSKYGLDFVKTTEEFDGEEGGAIPVDNDFREIVLIQNPYLNGTTTTATANSYSLYTKVKVSPGIGDFNTDEIVFQGGTFSDANFTGEVISFDTVENFLYLNNVRGTILENQAIKGFSTGSIRIVNDVVEPTMDLYSGKVLFS